MTAPKDTRIFQEIEATAGLYGPSVYTTLGDEAQGLLTHFHDQTVYPDPDGLFYFPMTSVKHNPREAKLFAVGVIPPSADVTGRILDRSATIAREIGVPEGIGDDTGTPTTTPTTSSGEFNENMKWGEAVGLLSDQFWMDFVAMCRRVGVDPVEWASIVFNESGFNPAATNWGGVGPTADQRKKEGRPVAVGLNQFIWSAGRMVGMTREEWENHRNTSPEEQLYWMEVYLNKVRARGHDRTGLYRKHFGGLGNPDGSAYATVAYQEKYVADQIAAGKLPPGTKRQDVFKRSDWQQKAYDQNSLLDKDKSGRLTYESLSAAVQNLPPLAVRVKLEEAARALGDSTPDAPEAPNGTTTSNWADEGSKDSKTSQEEKWKTSGVPLNQTELGLKLQAAQRQAIAEAQNAINGMRNIPPLRLLVNPSQFSVKGAKIVADGNWSRRGPIIEHWGDEQDVVSASGRVAAFYTLETGVGRTARQFSESWRNLQSLYLLYKNNGGIYLSDPYDPAGMDKRLTYVGSIYIYYDGILYIGSFSNFNLTEDEGTPFTVEYSFEFQVRAAFLLDRPDDKYNIQYSYQGTNAEQPKPPLPTKTPQSPPEDYATAEARLNEAIETSRRAREEAAANAEAAAQQELDETQVVVSPDGTFDTVWTPSRI